MPIGEYSVEFAFLGTAVVIGVGIYADFTAKRARINFRQDGDGQVNNLPTSPEAGPPGETAVVNRPGERELPRDSGETPGPGNNGASEQPDNLPLAASARP